MVLTVVILVILPIFLAVLLDSKFARFKNFFRSGLFIPSLVSVVVAGIIFRLIFAESPLAVANQIIGFFGFDTVNWQFTGWSAMFFLIILATCRMLVVNDFYYLADV